MSGRRKPYRRGIDLASRRNSRSLVSPSEADYGPIKVRFDWYYPHRPVVMRLLGYSQSLGSLSSAASVFVWSYADC